MFDVGFGELVLVFVVALVVLGPERLPHAIRSVARFVATAKSMANNIKQEVADELNVQELQESVRKAEKVITEDLSSQLKSSSDELKQVTQEVQRPYARQSGNHQLQASEHDSQ
ncbi:Sec-independent protein translocase protein TatB [Vibrio profundum]|uniref:Sec-independent protein translocase protein TatB n=1 Tax=Vibrio profundum TaxID=2910247 RepID=UPI003D0EE3F1